MLTGMLLQTRGKRWAVAGTSKKEEKQRRPGGVQMCVRGWVGDKAKC
jgi:hypothetical protein